MTQLPTHIAEFASCLAPAQGNDTRLTAWITAVRASDLGRPHAFANGLELDRAAVDAALTTPHHNARTEGVNTRTKRIMRQMHGRAGFDPLHHRILLP
nr:transposase [Embleya scabrispora]